LVSFRWGFKILGWLVLSVLLYSACLAVFLYGVDETIGRRNREVSSGLLEIERELEAATVTAARLDEFRAEREWRAKQLAELDSALPSGPEIDRLEADLKEIGKAVGVEVANVVPGQAEEYDFHAMFPLELGASGSYDALAEFGVELGKLPRLQHVRGIQLERNDDGFAARLRLDTYYYLRR
jgi:Tfp pilus assembly protein PilO